MRRIAKLTAPLLAMLLVFGSATIAGTGLASATAVGGTANATADAFLSGAISVGSLGATADSYGLGGLGLSIGAGLAQTSARALPGGKVQREETAIARLVFAAPRIGQFRAEDPAPTYRRATKQPRRRTPSRRRGSISR